MHHLFTEIMKISCVCPGLLQPKKLDSVSKKKEKKVSLLVRHNRIFWQNKKCDGKRLKGCILLSFISICVHFSFKV